MASTLAEAARPARRRHRPGRPRAAAAAAARARRRSSVLLRRAAPELGSRPAPARARRRLRAARRRVPAVDDVFIALGTTIKVAGSQAAFRAVDFDAVVASRAPRARPARPASALVSALGADAPRASSTTASRARPRPRCAALGFASVVIARPSLLLGDRAALGQPARPARRWRCAFSRPLGWLRAARAPADRRRRRRRARWSPRRRAASPACASSPPATCRVPPRSTPLITARTRSAVAALHLHPHPRLLAARLPGRELLAPLDPGQRIAPGLAQQLLEVAQAIRVDAVAHRAAGLVAVGAVAEAAARRQRLDVAEARRQRRLVDVGPQRPAGPACRSRRRRRAAGAASARWSCACRGCRARAPRRCPARRCRAGCWSGSTCRRPRSRAATSVWPPLATWAKRAALAGSVASTTTVGTAARDAPPRARSSRSSRRAGSAAAMSALVRTTIGAIAAGMHQRQVALEPAQVEVVVAGP